MELEEYGGGEDMGEYKEMEITIRLYCLKKITFQQEQKKKWDGTETHRGQFLL